MNEEPWLVFIQVRPWDLQNLLNDQAAKGYQLFNLTHTGDTNYFCVVMCNPTKIASAATANLQAMLAGLSAANAKDPLA